jgi:hypothetical protein
VDGIVSRFAWNVPKPRPTRDRVRYLLRGVQGIAYNIPIMYSGLYIPSAQLERVLVDL